jgi:hypothetical protein
MAALKPQNFFNCWFTQECAMTQTHIAPSKLKALSTDEDDGPFDAFEFFSSLGMAAFCVLLAYIFVCLLLLPVRPL